MRWSASAPVTWPADHRWQHVWSEAVAPLPGLATVDASGEVHLDGAGPGDPRVQLVSGPHLQPGAEYRIAPELTVGVLRAWVGSGRAAGLEWAPHAGAGRAHVELQGLDRLTGVRAESTLPEVQGRVLFTLTEPERLLDVEAEVPWLRATVTARVRGGQLEVEVGARGLGMWWPTLAPVFLGGRAAFQRELETAVTELAQSLTDLAVTGELRLGPPPETLAERQQRHEALIRAGMDELGRRQRAVAATMAAVPRGRRTRGRWRREVAALPAVVRPGEGLSWPATWPEVETELTTAVLAPWPWQRLARVDQAIAAFTETLVERRRELDADAQATVDSAAAAPRTEPWLTDEAFDLSWLATPTRVIRGLS